MTASRDTCHSPAAVVVLPPPENLKDAPAMEQLAGTLSNLPSPVSLEIAGAAERRCLIVRGEPSAVEQVTAQLYAVFGQVRIDPLPPGADPARAIAQPGDEVAAARLTLASPEFLPLKTWREFEGGDPLAALLGAFDNLCPGEFTLSQIVIRGAAPAGWADAHLEQLVHLKRRGFGGDAPMPAGAIFARGILPLLFFVAMLGVGLVALKHWSLLAIVALLGMAFVTALGFLPAARNRWTGAMEDEAAMKLRELAFVVEIRLFARAATRRRAEVLLRRLVSAYRMFDTTSGNQFAVHDGERRSDGTSLLDPLDVAGVIGARSVRERLAAALRRRWRAADGTLLLNVKELSGMWHMPVGEAMEMVERQMYENLLPLPDAVRVTPGPGNVRLGVSEKGEDHIEVWLSPEALRRNLFIIGKTQMGKSTLMEHIGAGLARDPDRAVLVIDPHGDLARRFIGLVPPERAGDVIYIDLSDPAYSVSLNLLDVAGGATADKVAEDFINIGKALWKNFWGPRMIVPLGFGLRALATANLRRPPDQQYTILSLATLLTANSEARKSLLDREVPRLDRPDIRNYFEIEYQDSSPSFREQVISPVLSKAHAFERSPAIRRLVGQPRSTVDLFQAIRGRKIVVVNANSGALGDDLAGFLGSLVLGVVREVIVRQTELPREQRVGVTVIADEFQIMAGGVDFGALLGELQKYGGRFVIGTQSLDNLRGLEEGGTLPGKVFAGVSTLIALQCNGEDARHLVEHELDVKRLQAESLINLPPHHAYVKTVDSAGNRLPVYSLRVAPPLAPEPAVAAAVQAGRAAYAVPAEAADRRVRESIDRVMREHGEALNPDGAQPADPGRESQDAAHALRSREAAPDRAVPHRPSAKAAAQPGLFDETLETLPDDWSALALGVTQP